MFCFMSGIVEYMEGQQGDPSSVKNTVKELQKAMMNDDVTVVGFFENEDDFAYQTYQEAGKLHF